MEQKQFSEALGRLTLKQMEVLSRVLAGKADSEVAQALEITQSTVRKHVERIYRVFDFASEFPDDRRSKRGDLFALFAKYKPEMLGAKGVSSAFEHDVVPDKHHTLDTLFNPFVPLTGWVDEPQLFFNRKREIRQVFEILNSGGSVAVIGERGIGKSSLLLAICREAKQQLQPPREPIYLNLQLLENEDEFYADLCEQVGIEKSRGYMLTRALRGKRLLLAIDKVEKMTRKEFSDGYIFSHLRGLVEGSEAPVRLVLAASKPLNSLFEDEGMTSPFTNICIEENLGTWEDTTARAFIADRLDSSSVTFTEEEIIALVQESGGHPQRLMQLCYQTYARYVDGVQ
jgi:DNA-binding CsgD family transcriptional regulator